MEEGERKEGGERGELTGYCRFLVCLFVIFSELSLMAATMHQLTGISKDLKIHKDSFRLHACFLRDTTDPESPQFSPE